MRMKIKNSRRYADPSGPHMPQIEFLEGTEVDVSVQMGADLLKNGDAVEVLFSSEETKVITPEPKEQKKKVKRKK